MNRERDCSLMTAYKTKHETIVGLYIDCFLGDRERRV